MRRPISWSGNLAGESGAAFGAALCARLPGGFVMMAAASATAAPAIKIGIEWFMGRSVALSLEQHSAPARHLRDDGRATAIALRSRATAPLVPFPGACHVRQDPVRHRPPRPPHG